MKKKISLLFYKLYCFFKAMSDDGWSDWKATLVIQTLQLFILGIIFLQIEMLNTNIEIVGNPQIIALVLGIGFALVNYYIFLHLKIWKDYESEFKSYPKQKNRVINFIVFCIVFGVLSTLIFTYYQFSQIDWSKYR